MQRVALDQVRQDGATWDDCSIFVSSSSLGNFKALGNFLVSVPIYCEWGHPFQSLMNMEPFVLNKVIGYILNENNPSRLI